MTFPGDKSCNRYSFIAIAVDLKHEGYEVELEASRAVQSYLQSVSRRSWALHKWAHLVFDEDGGPLIIVSEYSQRIWERLPEQVREDALVEDFANWAMSIWFKSITWHACS